MKKKIIAIALGLTLCLGMTGCASWDRFVVDMKSRVYLENVERKQLLNSEPYFDTDGICVS